MTLHPLTSKGGAFVLKLGLVFNSKTPDHSVWGFAIVSDRGIRTHLNATPRWGVAATSANTGGYLYFRQRRKCISNPSSSAKE